jgi:hypothetical protein
MKTTKLPLAGACRCGRVKIEVTAAPVLTAACHCTGCRRMSASAFSLTALFPKDAFRVVQGDPAIGGMHAAELLHHFCPHCKSWMFTRLGFPGMDGFVNVRPTMFDDCAWFAPFIETMTREKFSWATTPARHSFEGFPPMEDFAKLIEEYANVS